MTAGDTESVLQLTIGLNLAYFSFRELRTPVAARVQSELASAKARAADAKALLGEVRMPATPKPFDEETSLARRASSLLATVEMHDYNLGGYAPSGFDPNIADWDRGLRVIAITTAAAGLVALFIASIFASLPLSVEWFMIGSVVSLLPTGLAVFYNWKISTMMDQSGAKIADLVAEIDKVVAQFRSEIEPAYRELMADKTSARG